MKFQRILIVSLFVISTFLVMSCSSKKIKPNIPAEERMKIALKMFNDKDYYNARQQFKIITFSHSGLAMADKAQFYLSECHFFMKEYILAASEYERLTKIFPNSEYVDDAKFKLGVCYYKLSPKASLDQEYNIKAISVFQEFLEDFYSSDLVPQVEKMLLESQTKLAKKLYSSAELYRKMSAYEAAILYYNKVLERYYDTIYAPKAQYWIGECNLKIKNYSQALEAYQLFVNKYQDEKLVKKAKNRIADIQKKIDKNKDKESDNTTSENS